MLNGLSSERGGSLLDIPGGDRGEGARGPGGGGAAPPIGASLAQAEPNSYSGRDTVKRAQLLDHIASMEAQIEALLVAQLKQERSASKSSGDDWAVQNVINLNKSVSDLSQELEGSRRKMAEREHALDVASAAHQRALSVATQSRSESAALSQQVASLSDRCSQFAHQHRALQVRPSALNCCPP